jgi:hypothetical protein
MGRDERIRSLTHCVTNNIRTMKIKCMHIHYILHMKSIELREIS